MAVLSIDHLYEGFAASLPPGLRELARELPYVLKLAPVPSARFSEVFSHQVTLGAPWLLAEAFPTATPEMVRRATLAHALSVIEAFGNDRVSDGQVQGTSELVSLLAYLRHARDRALEALGFDGAEGALADERCRAAIAEERALLAEKAPICFAEYERISLGKQAPGFPGALALARAAGASTEVLSALGTLLEGVWLGLQFEDDVVDWEDDFRSGGAWAVCLARGLRADLAREDLQRSDAVRRAVLESGALCSMLERSCQRYLSAAERAQALGAERLSAWARTQHTRLETMIRLEAQHAGYSVRARKLSAWAAEVLA